MTCRTEFPTRDGKITVGDGMPTYLISEIGLNHNGSEALAREMIYQSSLAGATFVKFQKRSPSDLAAASFLDEPFEKCPALGSTQREVRDKLELDLEAYIRLRKYAESLGLIFCASAFDLPSLNFLYEAGCDIIKVASHSITNGELLEELAKNKTAVIVSLGGTTLEERNVAISILKHNPMVLLHCVSSYPTADSLVKLDTINHLKSHYGLPVGFSSHEVGIDISVAASVLGACMIERHFTLNKSMVGLDQAISLEPKEFSQLAGRVRRLKAARGIVKDIQAPERVAKNAYHVSLRAKMDLEAGTILSREHVSYKQPLIDPDLFFTGLEADKVLGQRLEVDLKKDDPFRREMFT